VKLNAYVLAADPTWLRASVLAYYPYVEKLIVSYDADSRGFTGAPIRVEECLALLRTIDTESKIEFLPGHHIASDKDYLGADTQQRSEALAHAALGADWVLQIDTDEVLPNWSPVEEALATAESLQLPAVEWPLRVLFRRLRDGSYLEVVTDTGSPHFEYATIAVRPGIELVECRRTAGSFLRPIVRGDRSSLQLRRPPVSGEHRAEILDAGEAIWHNSWARSPAAIREKIASWSHNQGAASRLYYYRTWLPAPFTWRVLRRFHPVAPELWYRLQKSAPPPVDDD